MRGAKIFKFRRFRCKNAQDSLQTLSARNDETYRVFGAFKTGFNDCGDAMLVSLFLVARLRKIINKRSMLDHALSFKSNELHL